jgi:hypothetical protein
MAHKAERVARDSGADLQIAIAAAWLVRLLVARGDLADAGALEQERSANVGAAAAAARMVDQVTSVRLLHAQGSPRGALRLLERPYEAAKANGRTRDLIEILSLRALAQWASNEKERAVGTLAEALVLAAPEGYVRTFLDEGPNMPRSCRRGSQPGRKDERTHCAACRRITSGSLCPCWTRTPQTLRRRLPDYPNPYDCARGGALDSRRATRLRHQPARRVRPDGCVHGHADGGVDALPGPLLVCRRFDGDRPPENACTTGWSRVRMRSSVPSWTSWLAQPSSSSSL